MPSLTEKGNEHDHTNQTNRQSGVQSNGHLETGSVEEVNEKYSDAHLISEARYRLDVAMDEANQDEESWQEDAKQLRRFIKKWA